MNSICIFGDSTAWGAWDLEKGGWVNRLWFHVAKRSDDGYVEIYNQSISGGTSETILQRFETEAKNRNADALLFQTGSNDAAYEKTPGNFRISLDNFQKNLEKMIRLARAITPNIAFMDLKNCDESKTMPVPWIDHYYANENILRYSEVMKSVCLKHGVLFIDIKPLQKEDFDDGLHPNASGHERIFTQAKDFLEEHGWI